MEGYTSKVVYCSNSDLTPIQKVKLKTMSGAIMLDLVVEVDKPLEIEFSYYAKIEIHNEHSKGDKDYTKYLIVDSAGTTYVTGSKSFYSALLGITDDLSDEGVEPPYMLRVYKVPSKNYQGKTFLSVELGD